MNIAVIGWGSLVWQRKELALRSGWRKDGPSLPIEFARISKNGRLTLVLHPGSMDQRTYWALSSLDSVESARRNLAKRERTPVRNVGSTSRDAATDVHLPCERIRDWVRERPDVEAAIWTALPPTLGNDAVAAAVSYLLGLDPLSVSYKDAREYVVKAPSQIQTPVRSEMRRRGWTDVKLADHLFEV